MKLTPVRPWEARVIGTALKHKTEREAPTHGKAATRDHKKDVDLLKIVESNINAHRLVHGAKETDDSGAGIGLTKEQRQHAVQALTWAVQRWDVVGAQLRVGTVVGFLALPGRDQPATASLAETTTVIPANPKAVHAGAISLAVQADLILNRLNENITPDMAMQRFRQIHGVEQPTSLHPLPPGPPPANLGHHGG